MSNICPIAEIWIKMYIFSTFLHIYLMNQVCDFLNLMFVTLFFTHKHLKMVKNYYVCILILSDNQSFWRFFSQKIFKIIFNNKKQCKFSCSSRSLKLMFVTVTYLSVTDKLERTSKYNFWHNSRVNRRSFGKVVYIFFKIIPLNYS